MVSKSCFSFLPLHIGSVLMHFTLLDNPYCSSAERAELKEKNRKKDKDKEIGLKLIEQFYKTSTSAKFLDV